MKSSRYNIIENVDGASSESSLIYNSKTGRIVFVDSDIASFLKSGKCDISDCSSEDHKVAVKQLAEDGFLIDNSIDELEELRAEYISSQKDQSIFSLCIALTYACNLSCPYCYEAGSDSPKKLMSRDVQDKIVDFAKTSYEASPYNRIEIQWFGGEPMLAPETIKHISDELMSFCDSRGIEYGADMVSNATLIDPASANLLKEARVARVVTTIDGPASIHNIRRPAKDDSDSYEAAMDGIKKMLECGINVIVQMNTDKVNDSNFEDLNKDLQHRFGINAIKVKLNDYYNTFGCGDFCEPSFCMMDHKEFAELQCRSFCEEGHSSEEFEQLLQPIDLFCRGQRERYFAIDAIGDVYKCDGHLGRTEHVLFNLADLSDAKDLPVSFVPEYPFNTNECISCSLLPLCKGNCEWERTQCSDHPCHPLKYTIGEYLNGWAASNS